MTGKKRYDKAIVSGLQTKKYALPPGVRPGGHGGSHGYLGDDFIDAIVRVRKPAVNVIDALNMTTPGYYAHLSAMKDGETLRFTVVRSGHVSIIAGDSHIQRVDHINRRFTTTQNCVDEVVTEVAV